MKSEQVNLRAPPYVGRLAHPDQEVRFLAAPEGAPPEAAEWFRLPWYVTQQGNLRRDVYGNGHYSRVVVRQPTGVNAWIVALAGRDGPDAPRPEGVKAFLPLFAENFATPRDVALALWESLQPEPEPGVLPIVLREDLARLPPEIVYVEDGRLPLVRRDIGSGLCAWLRAHIAPGPPQAYVAADVHIASACVLFGKRPSEITAEEWAVGKKWAFARAYS